MADIRASQSNQKRKKNIFSKVWKSFSKLGRSSSRANLYGSARHVGSSFGGSSFDGGDGSDSGVMTTGSTTTRNGSYVAKKNDTH